jgi:hypothetical protein
MIKYMQNHPVSSIVIINNTLSPIIIHSGNVPNPHNRTFAEPWWIVSHGPSTILGFIKLNPNNSSGFEPENYRSTNPIAQESLWPTKRTKTPNEWMAAQLNAQLTRSKKTLQNCTTHQSPQEKQHLWLDIMFQAPILHLTRPRRTRSISSEALENLTAQWEG